MEHQNEEMVARMSDEERKRHASEILEQLGPNMNELVRKVKRTRELGQADSTSVAGKGVGSSASLPLSLRL